MKFILGTAQLGMEYGIGPKGKAGQADRAVGRAFDVLAKAEKLGIRWLDTSPMYGNAYEIIGAYRWSGQVATKINPDLHDNVNDFVEDSCKTMRLNALNVLFIHALTEGAEKLGMDRMYFESTHQVVSLGISTYTPEKIDEKDDLRVIEVPASILDVERICYIASSMAGTYEVWARSPFLQGLLLLDDSEIPGQLRGVLPYKHQLEIVAHYLNITPLELYVQYIKSLEPLVHGIVVGVQDVVQLEEVYRAFARDDIHWKNDTLDIIHSLQQAVPEFVKSPRQWGYNYEFKTTL